ncbi:TetR/AcrR family transcriptional regulator [Streptacidiphilus fuscans]|nr:TetR/AcrR family transcriptional regulator [Streptacidiphilus fuscans]
MTGAPTSGTPSKRGPRERMVYSAAQLIRRDGVGATGMRDVAVHANAPRGSLQHYFPGGKEQLVNEAVGWAGRYAARQVERFLAALRSGGERPRPSELFAAMVGQWTTEFETVGFASGCPVAAVTVDCVDASESARTAAAEAFGVWIRPTAAALRELGIPEERTTPLATLMISALEGALLMARAEQDIRALATVSTELGPLLDGAVSPGV